ncbi:MAG: class I SAM-dependent methyltransferase [Acidimicrobiia bacterium]
MADRVLLPEEDAYGQAMLDALDGQPTLEVVERDDGYVGLGAGPELYLAQYEQWRQVERDAMAFVSGRVLDIGCGAGRFMLHLRSLGHEVVGIDNSPGAIQACNRRGLSQAHLQALQELGSELGNFDTILMLGGNFGLLGAPEEARETFRRLREMMRQGGRLLGASRDPRATSDPDRLSYMQRNVEEGRLPGHFRIRIRYRRFATPWFDFLRVSPEEMGNLADGTGWQLVKVLREDESLYIGVLQPA